MQIPFLAQALTAQYGEAVAAQIEQGMGEQRITTLRANLLKTTPEDVASVLSAAGIAYTRWAAEDAAFLLEGADERAVQALPLYERGEIYLQSLSSMLPPLALAPQEGADILMIKPAMPYLDLVRECRDRFDLPVAAYQVSGEYAMIKAAAKAGLIDEYGVMCESAVSIFRAGADILITYFACELADVIRKGDIG